MEKYLTKIWAKDIDNSLKKNSQKASGTNRRYISKGYSENPGSKPVMKTIVGLSNWQIFETCP